MLDKSELYRAICFDDSSYDFETLEEAEQFAKSMFFQRPEKFPIYLCKIVAKYDIINRNPELRIDRDGNNDLEHR